MRRDVARGALRLADLQTPAIHYHPGDPEPVEVFHQAIAGTHCRTKNGHNADAYHKPRITRAPQAVDEDLGEER